MLGSATAAAASEFVRSRCTPRDQPAAPPGAVAATAAGSTGHQRVHRDHRDEDDDHDRDADNVCANANHHGHDNVPNNNRANVPGMHKFELP